MIIHEYHKIKIERDCYQIEEKEKLFLIIILDKEEGETKPVLLYKEEILIPEWLTKFHCWRTK